MKDEFVNRMAMFKTARDFLQIPEKKAVWFNQPPLIFTAKVATLPAAIAALELYCQRHGVDLTGAAVDKDREETDVEDVAHTLSRPLRRWFLDHDNATDAAKCPTAISTWRKLRDQTLITKAREIRDLAIPIAVLTGADEYGITSGLIQQLTDEINEYEAVISKPQTAISGRKALTAGLRAEFNQVEALFDGLDDIIIGYNNTAAGRELIAGYTAARIIRDAGHGPATPPPTPTPPPGP